MMRVHAQGRSDVGRVRAANEDAFHVGDSVFAVADGMGGHVAGEVASSTALEPITRLDGRVFPDAGEARSALSQSLVLANQAVVTKAAGDPSFRGMGTTLTAVMIEGRRAHIAHVGDSRAYLFRDQTFSQLTTDHTLVQRMIDEGRLTREEAAHHPQRSVITRAIGVEADVDVDAMSLDLAPGDVLVLCSDGLTGPVDDDTIAEVLETAVRPSDLDGTDLTARVNDAATRLVESANRAGGPDNITVIVLAFEELPTAPAPRATGIPVVVSTRPDESNGNWASRLGHLGAPGGHQGTSWDGADQPPRTVGRGQRITVIVIVVGLLLGAVIAGGRYVLSRSFYVGLDGNEVVIFQGVPTTVGPFDLSWEYEATGLTTDGLPAWIVENLEDGSPATSLTDAQNQVANFRRQADEGDSQ